MPSKKKVSKQTARKKTVVKKKSKKKSVSRKKAPVKKLSTKERMALKEKAKLKADTKLSVRQEECAQAYIENGGNQSNAYRTVFNTENMTSKSVWEESSRLFALPKVRSRVLELMEDHKERHNVTIDSITVELDENRDQARVLGNPAAMNQSTLGKAKIHGLLIEKAEVTGKDGAPLDTTWVVQVMQAKK